jgi:hypothetical protein
VRGTELEWLVTAADSRRLIRGILSPAGLVMDDSALFYSLVAVLALRAIFDFTRYRSTVNHTHRVMLEWVDDFDDSDDWDDEDDHGLRIFGERFHDE